jgi:hypothetical protein
MHLGFACRPERSEGPMYLGFACHPERSEGPLYFCFVILSESEMIHFANHPGAASKACPQRSERPLHYRNSAVILSEAKDPCI